MKHRICCRLLSVLLLIALAVTLFSGLTVFAATGRLTVNPEKRHIVCTALSTQAKAYYTGTNTYANLSKLSGASSATDSYAATQNNPLYSSLQTLMSDTQTFSPTYSGTGTTALATYWKKTDAVGGVTGYQYFYTDISSNSYGTSTMEREHIWPKSKASFVETNGGSDLHHLRPSIKEVNQAKSNYAFGNVVGVMNNPTATQINGVDVIWVANSYLEVRDNVKGDVARILLYVYCRWGQPNLYSKVASAKLPANDAGSTNSGEPVIESLDTLLEWCALDPVDTWEMARNDQAENVQGNRNVFIDYPEYAWLIFGLTPPSDMQTPSGEAMSGTASYTISAVSNNTAYGTVSVSGNTITATPAAGYYASGYQVTSGSATVTQNGNTFTVDAASNCTIRIIFAAKTLYTVSFSVPNGVTQASISCYSGESLILPTPTGTPTSTAQSYTFVGWVTASVTSTTAKPTVLSAGTSYTPTASTTLYALYSYAEAGSASGSGEWTLVTDASKLSAGVELLIASNAKGYVAGNISSSIMVNIAADFASDGSTVTKPDNAVVLTLGGSAGAWTLANADGQLLGATAVKKLAWDSGTTTWTISVENGDATISSTTSTYGRFLYNVGSPRFTTYTSSASSSMLLPQLYILDGTSGTVYYTTVLETACAHEYTDVVTPATCTTDGYTTHTCSLCGYTYDDSTVPATGHSYNDGVITTEATCETAGVKTYTCANCGDTYTETIASLGHNYVDGICTNCGAAQGTANTYCLITAESALASGKYVLIVKAGGSHSGSYSYYALKRQADGSYVLAEAADSYIGTSSSIPGSISVSDDTIVWDAAYGTTLALSDGGTNVIYTTSSNATYYGTGTASAWTPTFDAQTQTFILQTTDTAGKTRYLGLRDDLTTVGSNGNPRFRCNSEAATTSYQFYLYKQTAASHTHVGTAVSATAATCTTAGNLPYWICSCGKLFSDAACTVETTLEAVTLASTGHTAVTDKAVAPTCTQTGLTAGSHCSVCQAVLTAQKVVPATGHSYKAVVTAPTCTTGGYTTYTCSACGGSYIANKTAALGHSYGYTDNGDGTHTVTCANCGDTFTEAHSFTDGTCVCGAVESTEPTVDGTISIGQQLFLESDLSLTFRIKESQLIAYDVSTAYLVVERDIYPTGGEMYVKTDTLTEYTIESSRLVFVYSGIAAAQMNDEIRVTLHIKDSSGKEYVSNTLTTSVTAYAKLLLDAYGTTQASLCTVLMDMLNYGTAAQLYFDRHADAPANTAYAEFANYTSYASAEFVTPLEDLSSVLTNEGATATMNLSVDLSTRVGIIYKVTLPEGVNAADATVIVEDEDGNALETLSLSDATTDSKGRYVVTYFGTPSRLMRRVVYGTVYVGGAVISNTYGYSISTYAYQIANTAGMPEALVNLTNLMTMYGDAANAYFGG